MLPVPFLDLYQEDDQEDDDQEEDDTARSDGSEKSWPGAKDPILGRGLVFPILVVCTCEEEMDQKLAQYWASFDMPVTVAIYF